MAGITKYGPISSNNNTLFSDMKPHFSIFRTKKTAAFGYGFIFFFLAFTIFLAFTPSTNSSSPFFSNIFSGNISSHTQIFSDQSYRSHFSSIYYYFFPDPSQNTTSLPLESSFLNQTESNLTNPSPKSLSSEVLKQNQTQSENGHDKDEALKVNQTTIGVPISANNTVNNQTNPPPKFSPSESLKQNQSQSDKVEVSKANQTVIGVPKSPNNTFNNQTSPPPKSPPSESLKLNQTQSDQVEVLKGNQTIGVSNSANKTGNSTPNVITDKGVFKNLTSSLMKKPNDGVTGEKQGIDDLVKSLMNCDFFDGNWVKDESYPLYKPGSCSLIDDQFKCILNGRPDNGYHKLRWKPKGCNLPRLDGSHMLEMLKGKRLVFVGDSLNRNMWESLICILRNSAKDQKKVYEQSGKHHFKSDPSYSFVFHDYKLTVEFFVSPFLVREWETSGKDGSKKETLRLDLVGSSADKYKDADIIVFNTGHWWTHDKTAKGKDYYQEGSHVYNDLNVMEAFRKAITTWGRWIDANVNPKKSLVFFRGYSASHFSGGRWNSGGQCDHETEPIKNDTYLAEYPSKMKVLEKVMRGMKTDVTYLNVTRMTDYRKDGHPSIYRKQNSFDLSVQDCSHWCLPGVPDTWNEMLYAKLLIKLNHKSQ